MVAGDRNDLGIDLISSLDPTLRQVVRENTNKLNQGVGCDLHRLPGPDAGGHNIASDAGGHGQAGEGQ